MKRIAKKRYEYEYENKSTFSGVEILQSTSNKYSILRELCKIMGVVIESKEYQLENNQTICID